MDKTVELRKKELRKKELRKNELRMNELVAFFEPKADSADPRNLTVISNSINGRTVIDGHDPYYKFPEGGPRKSDRDHNLTSGPDPPLLIGFRVKGSVWSKKSFPFFAENMTIRSILNLWWHSEILKLILGVVRGMFTKRLKGTRRLLYTVKSDFFEMTALHSKC